MRLERSKPASSKYGARRSTNVYYGLDTVSVLGFLAFVNAAFGTTIPISLIQL